MRMCMELDGPDCDTPTWRIVPGSCTRSLALAVAAAYGLPLPLLQRAEHLYEVCTLSSAIYISIASYGRLVGLTLQRP